METKKGVVVSKRKDGSGIQVQFEDGLEWIYPSGSVESKGSFFDNIKVGATYAFTGSRSSRGWFYVSSYELLAPAGTANNKMQFAEQRDARITRMSVINASLKFFEVNQKPCTVEDVIKVASEFEKWVKEVETE